MRDYDEIAQINSRKLTNFYSTSFGLASRLYSKEIRNHIYNIYALARIADEIVDTYDGEDKKTQLEELEAETYAAMDRGYSSNLIVHAFQLTANKHNITKQLIEPFFESMSMDINLPRSLNRAQYNKYIYGSAEVIGLMCLRVFSGGNKTVYKELEKGAAKLGSGYQKVNFLRDFADDSNHLGRCYFPGVKIGELSNTKKNEIVRDIKKDFSIAEEYIYKLPINSRSAVAASYKYYSKLLNKLTSTDADVINQKRIRVGDSTKLLILAKFFIKKVAGPNNVW